MVKETLDGLSIGQKIVVQSSHYFNGEFIEVHPTTLADATEDNGKVRIRMSNSSNWGACPTRDRKSVIVDEADIKSLFDTMFQRDVKKTLEMKEKNPNYGWLTMEEKLEQGKVAFIIKDNGGSIKVIPLTKGKTVKSLSQGETTDYVSNDSFFRYKVTVKGDNIPNNLYTDKESLFEEFKRVVMTKL